MPLAWSLPVLRLITARSQTIDASWRWSLHDAVWRLYRNHSAGAVIRHPGGELALVPGRVVLVPPWLAAWARCRGTLRHDHLLFDVAGLAPAVVRRSLPAPLVLPESGPWADLFTGLPWKQPPPPARQMSLLAGLSAAVGWALAQAPGEDSSGTAVVAAGIFRAIEAIEHHPQEAWNVTLLAELCDLDRHRFTRRFSRVMGQSPARYLMQRRTAAAAWRLASGDETIPTVAEACGFRNRYHFSRVFAAQLGCGPAAYRRLRQQAAPV